MGNNYYRATEKIIEALLSFDRNYGVIISGADATALEFWFKRAPTGRQAQEVGERLLQLAPDIRDVPMTLRRMLSIHPCSRRDLHSEWP